MIKISSPQNQLRSNRNLLLLVGGCSTVAGLFIWSASPFVFNNTKDKVSILLRYFSLAATMTAGITAVATGHQLQRIAPLIKAVEQAERNDFLTELASSEYVQQQQWQQMAMTALQPPATVGYGFDGNGGNDELPSVTNDVTDSVTEPVTDATDTATLAYKPMYLSVTALQQQGVAESKIIKEVLQQEGRNYAAGKQMLDALLQLGRSQGW